MAEADRLTEYITHTTMTEYKSKQKQILRPVEEVYARVADLKALEDKFRAVPRQGMPEIKDLAFTPDTISFRVDPVGEVVLRIVDREAPKTIKFGADNFPIQFNLWIQFKAVAEADTRMLITLKADIPLMLRPMIGNKLETGIEQFADRLAEMLSNA